jgi:SAM-dependent methyltransferase
MSNHETTPHLPCPSAKERPGAKPSAAKVPGAPLAPSFAEFYRQDIERQLRAGLSHSTLGGNLKRDDFASAGRDVFAKLRGFGLGADAVCVDYGCGTLRVGQHIIRLLDIGCYWGLDISDYLLDEGRRLLGSELLEAKRPNLRRIGPQSIAEAAAQRPALVFANAVLMHVHPDEMARFASHLLTLAGDWGQALFTVKRSVETVRYSPRSWSHAGAAVDAAFAALGVDLEVLASEPSPAPGAEDSRRCWMRAARPDLVPYQSASKR